MVLLERVNEVMYVTFFHDEDLKPGSWPGRLQNSSLIAHLFPMLKLLPFLHLPLRQTPHTFPVLFPTSSLISSPNSAQQIDTLFPFIHPQILPSFLFTQVLSKPLPKSSFFTCCEHSFGALRRGAQQKAIPLSPGAVSFISKPPTPAQA